MAQIIIPARQTCDRTTLRMMLMTAATGATFDASLTKDQTQRPEETVAELMQPAQTERNTKEQNGRDITTSDDDLALSPPLFIKAKHGYSIIPQVKPQQRTTNQSMANKIDIDTVLTPAPADARPSTETDNHEQTAQQYQRQTIASVTYPVSTNFETVSAQFCRPGRENGHRHHTRTGSRTIDVGDGLLRFHEIVGHFHDDEDMEHNALEEDHECHCRVHPGMRKEEQKS